MLHYPTLLLVQVGITVPDYATHGRRGPYGRCAGRTTAMGLGQCGGGSGAVIGAMSTLPVLVHGGVSYALVGLGFAMALRGLRQFCGHTLSWRWIAGITFFAFILPAYFALIEPNQTQRMVLACTYLGGISLLCAATLWRDLHGTIVDDVGQLGGVSGAGLGPDRSCGLPLRRTRGCRERRGRGSDEEHDAVGDGAGAGGHFLWIDHAGVAPLRRKDQQFVVARWPDRSPQSRRTGAHGPTGFAARSAGSTQRGVGHGRCRPLQAHQ